MLFSDGMKYKQWPAKARSVQTNSIFSVEAFGLKPYNECQVFTVASHGTVLSCEAITIALILFHYVCSLFAYFGNTVTLWVQRAAGLSLC